jgi:hypothetical protein
VLALWGCMYSQDRKEKEKEKKQTLILSKSLPEEMAASTEARVRTQIEFYLSSSNLMKDKFLRPIVQADPKGYVDVAMFANFPRVQSITRDLTLLVRALRQSSELKVNRDGTRVKRKEPFVEYDTEANTVYTVCTATLRR